MTDLGDDMPLAEYSANDIATFTAAIVSATRQFGDTRPWWRGHGNMGWSLQPSLYRKGLEKRETNLNARFRMMAKVRHSSCPSSTEPLAWLFLMQHYGLPTRL